MSGFQLGHLVVFASLDAPNGPAIKDALDGYDGPEVHPGRLYPNLDEFVLWSPWRTARSTTDRTRVRSQTMGVSRSNSG